MKNEIIFDKVSNRKYIDLHKTDDEEFIRVSELLERKFLGTILNKILIDIELWEFIFPKGLKLSMTAAVDSIHIVAIGGKNIELLDKVYEYLENE